MTINSEMIRLARESRGLSQAELCDKLQVAQGTISKIENKLIDCSADLAELIATKLEYPLTFFYRTELIFPASMHYYRRKLTLGKKILNKAEARMNILRMGIEQLLNEVEIPEQSFGRWDVEHLGSPTMGARFLRESWRLPKGRIDNITSLLEQKGIIIFHFDFGSDKLDGLSFYTQKGHPIIFVNRTLPGDRLRLTIAHELGHLYMHIGQPVSLDRDVEAEAYEFGSEFLVPIDEFSATVTIIDLKFLADQKRYWKVAMSALVVKARKNNIITENQAKYLYSQLSALGYRKSEPVELAIEKEHPTLIKNVMDLYRKELGYSPEQLAATVHMSMKDFDVEFDTHPFGLRLLRRN
ncbi:MAG: ImmA/IrrE family metallo-endopeptidase [Cyclobacteriaceae bacterium]|nr:ImmA/IrrE family metallo-endopeptidase [Cyclobacteriaceae bacterium]